MFLNEIFELMGGNPHDSKLRGRGTTGLRGFHFSNNGLWSDVILGREDKEEAWPRSHEE